MEAVRKHDQKIHINSPVKLVLNFPS